MADVTDAKVMETMEPNRVEFKTDHIVLCVGQDGREQAYAIYPRARAFGVSQSHEAHVFADRKRKKGCRTMVVRLPSESEAALAPLVDAYHKAAVAIAKQNNEDCEDYGTLAELQDVFNKAEAALEAARKGDSR